MSIDGIPQGNNPISKIDTTAAAPTHVHRTPKVTPAPSPKATAPTTPPPQATAAPKKNIAGDSGVAKPNVVNETTQPTAAQTMMELQSTTEKLRQSNAAFQTRNQISDLGRSIVETKDALTEAAQERLAEIVQSSEERSFFSSMGIMEKAQHINRLKDQIKDMEIERSALVKDLRDKVIANEYDPSGDEILQGMISDYF